MKLTKCHIKNFTVFEDQEIEFCPGINVIIGANGTGKSHLLKILYANAQWSTCEQIGKVVNTKIIHFFNLLNGIFKPEEEDIAKLIRKPSKESLLEARFNANNNKLTSSVKLNDEIISQNYDPSFIAQLPNTKGVFIPPNEVLAIYPGFTASYEMRELAFDQTYYDLCKALSATPLKKKHKVLSELQMKLEEILQGTVVLKGDRFYVKYKDSKRTLEAHLIAEGHRKIAALVHLINNGSIDKDTLLFWDEPETNMNPRLIKHIADFLRGLANSGTQVFITSHDFLLTNELSLAAEYKTSPEVPIRFFAMSRQKDEPVEVQWGDTLADISDNSILDEFAAHYSREEELVIQRMKMGEKNECNPRRES